MDAREIEEFDLGIYLANNKQEQAANFVFSRLLENHPDNIYLLALCAFTSSTPGASLAYIETALKLEPANQMLLEAKSWLEDYYRAEPSPAVASSEAVPAKMPPRTAGLAHVTAAALKPSPRPAARPLSVTFKPKQTIKPATAAPTALPAAAIKLPAKPKATLAGFWWVFLGCSLLFLGAAMALFYMAVVADSLDAPERAYLDQVMQLNQQTSEINSQLYDAINQFNAGKIEKSDLEKHLRHVIGLDEKFRLLKSPSTRFTKLNGLLGQAFSYFDEGVANLINGLQASDTNLINEGNRLLVLGNNYLHQARDELQHLGG